MSADLDFIRLVVNGDAADVAARLAASPALATTWSNAGASRQNPSAFFFPEIAHYVYAGDTALHMASAAFRRPIAELLIAHGAEPRAKNRRGAEPLHCLKPYATSERKRSSVAFHHLVAAIERRT